MICVRCKTENTKCVDDMLTIGYVAEIYKCNDCGGTVEVEYKDGKISCENIKNYRYVTA